MFSVPLSLSPLVPNSCPCLPTLILYPASLQITHLGSFFSCGALMAWVTLGEKHPKLSETYVYHPNSQASLFFFLPLPAPSSHRRTISSCEAWNSCLSRRTLKDNEREKEMEGLRAWHSTRNSPTQTCSNTTVPEQADPMSQEIFP